ncbi:MAG TPA: asparagine synthase [Pseudonocardiaceae bacterium]|nr:asparagine synthase [Pseudonocardiaceae bacterium]
MLSFRIHLQDLRSTNWTWNAGRWTNRESWIQPVDNPALASQITYDWLGQVAIVIYERPTRSCAPWPTERLPVSMADAATSFTTTPPGEFLTVHLQPDQVTLAAGPFGSAPLFLAAHRGLLVGSWHLPDLQPLIRVNQLLDRAVTRRLIRQPRYSRDTVFANVHRLTERATATFTGTGLSFCYPTSAEHVLRPRELRSGSDVIEAFDELLASVVGKPVLGTSVAVELSGGADSANVAMTVASRRAETVSSYGLVLDGSVGRLQQHRRAAMIRQFGLRDTQVAARDHPPFAPTGIRSRAKPHDPTAAYYREAFDALCEAAALDGAQTVYTGMGGDELMARHPHEWSVPRPLPAAAPWLGPASRAALDDIDEDLAPVGHVHLPTLMALASHNPAYLAAGIWPVAPLAHPALVHFAEQLPLEWRTRKRLLRQRLHRAGLSNDVADPYQQETFSDLMQVGLRRFGLPILKHMLDGSSLLVDLGYLDHDALASVYTDALSNGLIPSQLCDAISLEVGLQSLGAAGCDW